jgi:hypothetical protein
MNAHSFHWIHWQATFPSVHKNGLASLFDIFSGARHLRLVQVLPGVRLRRPHQP